MDEQFKDKQLTEFSNKEINYLRNEYISAKEAYARLNGGIPARTFTEIVSHVYEGDIKTALIDGLCEVEEKISRESIAHKVRGWFSGKYSPTERISFIKICFALKLGEMKANEFLSLMKEGGFHMRNPEDLAYAYCLRVGKSYSHAVSLISGLKPLVKESALKKDALTKIVANAFMDIQTDEDFFRFYNEQYDNLGRLHNTAYKNFDEFLALLAAPPKPQKHMEQSEEYSVDYVVEIYLRMNIPQYEDNEKKKSEDKKSKDKKTKRKKNMDKKIEMTTLQKIVYERWPNAQSVVRVKKRQEDVTRRLLLLLYLVTEGEDGKPDKDEDKYDDSAGKEARFDSHYWRINALLHECGMSQLDPHSTFDWLILYGISKREDDEIMGERMQEVLDIVFGTEATAETSAETEPEA